MTGDSEISAGAGAVAVAPRPVARRWRRAAPGWQGLTLTSSVDDSDGDPSTTKANEQCKIVQ
jgi:hypothetical protein